MSKIIAIVSPNKNAYSETFIQAHRKHIKGKVVYYHGGGIPAFCEGDSLMPKSTWQRLIQRLLKLTSDRTLSFREFLLARSFKANRVEIVLAEYAPTAVAILKVVEKLDIPMMVHFHGYDAFHKPTINEYWKRYAEVFQYSKSIIAVSTAMKNELIRLGASPEKLHYNPYGVDVSFFDIKPEFGSKHFLAVGRFVDKKAPYLTLMSFKRVVEQHADARLSMVGDGPLWETCKELIVALGLENVVDLPGPLDRDHIQRLMASSIAFVQHSIRPSDGDSEGTPVAILEAQASGLPVVATRHAGIVDVVIEGVTGLLCDERDVTGMGVHMLFMVNNKVQAQAMGAAGKERIKRHFTMERHINFLNDQVDLIQKK